MRAAEQAKTQVGSIAGQDIPHLRRFAEHTRPMVTTHAPFQQHLPVTGVPFDDSIFVHDRLMICAQE